MKIVVLQGSPNRRGSTYLLADAFRRGAEAAGHTVESLKSRTRIFVPVPAACVAGTKAPAYRRTRLGRSVKKYWEPICSYSPRLCTITA